MRAEDVRLVRGGGCYVDDLALPGALEAAFLRSPFASARICSVDVSAAAAMPGIAAALTSGNLRLSRDLPVIRDHAGLRYPAPPPILARDAVRYRGEPVAMLLADDRYLAEDALEAITVDYQPHAAVVDPEASASGSCSVVHEAMPDNLAGMFTQSAGDAAAVLADAPVQLAFRCSIDRGSAQALEPRGIAAAPEGDGLRVWASTQRPRGIRLMLADYLGLPLEAIRLEVPDIGGSFGSKAYLYSEDVLVALAALRLRRPVRWAEDRAEDFLATFPEHAQIFDVEVGAERDGRVVALRVRMLHDLGAYSPYGFAVCQNTADHIVGPYAIPHVEFICRAVYTNKTPSAPYRGAGRPQGVFVIERAMDALARELSLDPAEIRRRNLIPPDAMPYDTCLDTPAGRLVYDSGDYSQCLETALKQSDYWGWRHRQHGLRAQGRLIGLGVANYIECSITQPHEAARVELTPEGRFRVAVGLSSQGQGHETVFAQIAADALRVPADAVQVASAAGEITETVGTYASRSAIMGGNAVAGAATALLRKLEDVAARVLGADQGGVAVTAAGIGCSGASPRLLTWREVRAAAANLDICPEAGYVFRSTAWHVSCGTHVAVIEIEPVTGHVRFLRYVVAHDAGRILNHQIVDGQVRGGVTQGVAGALLENLAYDEDGQLATGSFIDYLLPTAVEAPEVEIHHIETPSPHNPLGVKGAGEGGILPTYAVVVSAVEDATGARFDRTPLSPGQIAASLQAAKTPIHVLEGVGGP